LCAAASAIFQITKIALIAILLITGGAGFYWKNRAYMERGATSVVARFDYWRAAWQTATVKRPLFGTGPGTFAIAYQAVKRPNPKWHGLPTMTICSRRPTQGFPG
jgi:O-antigen ligase